MTRLNSMKLYEIIPAKLYQRGNFRKLIPGEKREFLSMYNIDIVVSLAGKYDYALANLDILYIHHYIRDIGGVLTNEQAFELEKIADTVSVLLRDGHCALVHCHRGRNRSAFLNCMIYMRLTGCSGQQAIEHMRSVRPNSLANEQFVYYLRNGDVG